MSTVAESISSIKNKIPSSVTILAVVKKVSLDKIFEALDCGINVIGENRIQEAAARDPEIRQKYPHVKVHMIGHLQKNKINQALEMFDVIESVDSYELAEAINKRAEKPIEVFLEVNTSGEETKYGVNPEEVLAVISRISNLSLLNLTGLMTIGAISFDTEKVRECFKTLRELRDSATAYGFKNIKHLSMGMSQDFPVAIEEGSDIIRLGTAIFGRR